jgi:hypothetical protein
VLDEVDPFLGDEARDDGDERLGRVDGHPKSTLEKRLARGLACGRGRGEGGGERRVGRGVPRARVDAVEDALRGDGVVGGRVGG